MNQYSEMPVDSKSKMPPFDKEAWGIQKQAERQDLYKLADDTAISAIRSGDQFRAYLDVQARFDRYSVTNALLILAQMPQATQIKDFDSWNNNGVSIRKEQKGFSILEPGKPYPRPDGTQATGYHIKKVFDISQTNAKTVTPTVNRDERTVLKALITNLPVPLQTVDNLAHDMGAYYDHSKKTIFARRGMQASDLFRSAAAEIAQAEFAAADPNYRRSDHAFDAYCVSYLLAKKYGMDVKSFAFDRVPNDLQTAQPQEIRSRLHTIRNTANIISKRMYRALDQPNPPRPKEQER